MSTHILFKVDLSSLFSVALVHLRALLDNFFVRYSRVILYFVHVQLSWKLISLLEIHITSVSFQGEELPTCQSLKNRRF